MVRCWRCAKNNGEGVEHCGVCRAKLELGAQPWFCRCCFVKCHHDTCSKCQGTRAEGEAAAKGAQAASAQAASVKQVKRASRTKYAADKWKMSTLHATSIQPSNASLENSETPYNNGSKDISNQCPVAMKASKSSPSHLWPLPPMQTDDDNATALAPERPHLKQQKQRKPLPKTAANAGGGGGPTRKPVYKQSEHQRLAALEKLVGISLPQIGGDSIAMGQGPDNVLTEEKLAAVAAAEAAAAATAAAEVTAEIAAELVSGVVAVEAAAIAIAEAAAAAAAAQAHVLNGATELERRIDPHDGTVATREQFEEYYGGFDEWDAAWPAEAPSHDEVDDGGYYDQSLGADEDNHGEYREFEGGFHGVEQEDYALSGNRLRRLNPYAAEDAEEVPVFKALDGPSWGLHLADDGSNVVRLDARACFNC